MLKMTALKSLCILLSLVLAAPGLAATLQWRSYGPEAGTVKALAISPKTPGTVYAAIYQGGVFKSTDSGQSWAATAFNDTLVNALVVDPDDAENVFVGTGNGKIFKSSDGGTSWQSASNGLSGGYVTTLNIDSSGNLYAGTWLGVFKSVDDGANWLPTALVGDSSDYYSAKDIRAMAVGKDGTLYAASYNGGIYKSVDNGNNWSQPSVGIQSYAMSLAVDPNNSQIIYAGTYAGGINEANDGVYKSTDGGNTWVQSSTNIYTFTNDIRSIAVNPGNSSIVYIGTKFNGIYKSTDAGATWQSIDDQLTNNSVNALLIAPGNVNTLYAATGGFMISNSDGGIVKSTDAGKTWKTSNKGLGGAHIAAIEFDPDNPQNIIAGGKDGLFKSSDGGFTWQPAKTGLSGTEIKALARDSAGTLYTLTGSYGGVYKSIDGGNQWSLVEDWSGLNSLVIDKTGVSDIFYGGTNNGVYKSVDSGQSWLPANTGMTNGNGFAFVQSVALGNAGTLYAATDQFWDKLGPVFKSVDYGASWSLVINGLPDNIWAKTLATDPLNATLYVSGTGAATLYKSIDAAGNWAAADNGLPPTPGVRAIAIDPANSNSVYAGLEANGVWKSIDGGGSWSDFNTGMPSNMLVNTLAINPLQPAAIYAGSGGRGVYVYSDQEAPEQTGEHTLNMTVGNGEGGAIVVAKPKQECTSSCSGSYDAAIKKVKLTAKSSPLYRFTGWSGACSGTAKNCVVTMDADKDVTATFEAIPRYSVSVSLQGVGQGVVSAAPKGIDQTIACGAVCSASYLLKNPNSPVKVILRAKALPDSQFVGWGGVCIGTQKTCVIKMSENQTVTAQFERKQ